jgi:hypothetical protein
MNMKAIMALTGHVDYEMILKVYGEIEAEKVFMPQINKEETILPAVAAFSNDIAAYIDSNTISKAV